MSGFTCTTWTLLEREVTDLKERMRKVEGRLGGEP
jgi:hypothetical protein